MKKWLYGKAWEAHPIQPGELWKLANGSCVAVHNLFDPLPSFMHAADLLFVDPPWNLSNLNSFYTKAERTDYVSHFDNFAAALFQRISEISPSTVYIEIGKQNVEGFYARLGQLYPHLQRWPVVYYHKYPTWIIRGSQAGTVDFDFTGKDEAKCIEIIAEIENYTILGDPCMGRGLVGLAAYRVGKTFVGTELNKRRLACLIDALCKRGAAFQVVKQRRPKRNAKSLSV